jgi:hypothetical protein
MPPGRDFGALGRRPGQPLRVCAERRLRVARMIGVFALTFRTVSATNARARVTRFA